MDQSQVNPYLAAFADGELDLAQNLWVLQRVKDEPGAAASVRHQQQLRDAVARAMVTQNGGQVAVPQPLLRKSGESGSASAILAPVDLRARIEAMLDDKVTRRPVPAVAGRIRRVGQVAAVAAVLALGGGVIWTVAHRTSDTMEMIADRSIIPAAQVTRLARRHVDCSHMIQRLRQFADAPDQLEEMPSFFSAYLGGHVYGSLDLSGVGYRFERVGSCRIPGERGAHLIYRAAPESGRDDAISLWMAPDNGSVSIKPDTLYRVRGADQPHPIVVWRHDGIVYYLVGDYDPAIRDAYALLAAAGGHR